MHSRSLRRLDKLADAARIKTGAEHALILKTLLKILDECSDEEYDAATRIGGDLLNKLILAGVEFDNDDEPKPFNSAAVAAPSV